MPRWNRCLCVSAGFAVAIVLAVCTEPASAQFNSSNARSVRNAARSFLYNRPTVSPYLNLTTRDASFGMSNYFTLVRPMMEQREAAVMQERQAMQMQAQLDEVQTQVRQSQQQSSGMMLTGQMGWSARGYPRFGSHLNYFPGFQRLR